MKEPITTNQENCEKPPIEFTDGTMRAMVNAVPAFGTHGHSKHRSSSISLVIVGHTRHSTQFVLGGRTPIATL
eukprot:scaffold17516_cov77-Attheya_sp.AAC.2